MTKYRVTEYVEWAPEYHECNANGTFVKCTVLSRLPFILQQNCTSQAISEGMVAGAFNDMLYFEALDRRRKQIDARLGDAEIIEKYTNRQIRYQYFFEEDEFNNVTLTMDLSSANSEELRQSSINMLCKWLDRFVDSEPNIFKKKVSIVLQGGSVAAIYASLAICSAQKLERDQKLSQSKRNWVFQSMGSAIVSGLIGLFLGGFVGFAIGVGIGLVGFWALEGFEKGPELDRKIICAYIHSIKIVPVQQPPPYINPDQNLDRRRSVSSTTNVEPSAGLSKVDDPYRTGSSLNF